MSFTGLYRTSIQVPAFKVRNLRIPRNSTTSNSKFIETRIVPFYKPKTELSNSNVIKLRKALRVIYCFSKPNSIELLQKYFGSNAHSTCRDVEPIVRSIFKFVAIMNPKFNFIELCEYVVRYNMDDLNFIEESEITEKLKPLIRYELDIISVREVLDIIRAGVVLENERKQLHKDTNLNPSFKQIKSIILSSSYYN